MKKLFLLTMICGSLMYASDEKFPERDLEVVASASSVLSATHVANICVVLPAVRYVVAKQLIKTMGLSSGVASCAAIGVGFLATEVVAQLINLGVLSSSKKYGHLILKVKRELDNKYGVEGFAGIIMCLAMLFNPVV